MRCDCSKLTALVMVISLPWLMSIFMSVFFTNVTERNNKCFWSECIGNHTQCHKQWFYKEMSECISVRCGVLLFLEKCRLNVHIFTFSMRNLLFYFAHARSWICPAFGTMLWDGARESTFSAAEASEWYSSKATRQAETGWGQRETATDADEQDEVCYQ